MEEQNKRNIFIPIAAVVVVAVIVVALARGGKTDEGAEVVQNGGDNGAAGTVEAGSGIEVGADDKPIENGVAVGEPNPNGSGTGEGEVTEGTYEDGTYTATGTYTSPGGPEEIGITLTVEGGIITDASAEPKATIPASVNWQTVFANNFKASVVGKSLDEVSLDKVSGSSLTPKGFNDAVEKIKAQAEA